MDVLVKTLDQYLVKKAPALPKNWKDILVKFAPWISILAVVLTLPAILSLLGLGALLSATPYGGYMMAKTGFGFGLGIIFLVVTGILRLLSVSGLLKRQLAGWNFIFYSVLVNAVYDLVSLNFASLIVGTLVSLYLLFQVKSYYK